MSRISELRLLLALRSYQGLVVVPKLIHGLTTPGDHLGVLGRSSQAGFYIRRSRDDLAHLLPSGESLTSLL
jgi:hypothetical protein